MENENYRNPELSPAERAADLLGRLTVEEKMAQTIGFLPRDAEDEKLADVTRYGIGEISTLEVRRLKSKEDAAAFQRRIQKTVMENSRFHIPAIFHMEGLCGAFIQDAMSFPSGIARGSSFDPALEKKIAQVVAGQERMAGFTQTLAPVLDISRDSRMGRQGETYGEDPTLAAAMGAAYTAGVQEGETDGRKSESVAKHFLAFHNSEAGIHGAASDTPRRLMEEVYGKPFQAAIAESSLRGVMPCYCSFDGESASTSHRMLTELLRDEMGFDGLVVADYSAISNSHTVQHLYDSLADTGYHSMAAGMDIELPNQECFNEELCERFRSGEADMAILDRAVLRILEAKFRMGLFEHPYAMEDRELDKSFVREEDRAISLQSAEESLVLLKNDGVLPLKEMSGKKIAVIGPHADNPRSFFGGYTHLSMTEAIAAVANSLAGIGEAAGNTDKEVSYIPGTQIQSDETEEFDAILKQIKPGCASLLTELKKTMPDTEFLYAYGYPVAGNDDSHFEEALKAVSACDLCILTLGGKHGSCSVATMGEGVDGSDINLPECQDRFIEAAASLGKPMVGIHFNGRPISSDAADRYLNAILEAWNPSETGAEAIVRTLTGKVNPSGKLPVSVAYNAGQIPIYYNHPCGSSWDQGASIGFSTYVDLPHLPRYCFGYGLSYTAFEYSGLTLSAGETGPDGAVDIGCRIRNTGAAAGTEVVQLYVKDEYASMVRPAMQLAGFRRVMLQPGEEQQVRFHLAASFLAFLNVDYRWKIEKGEIRVMIGAASDDIRLQDHFTITGDRFIEGRTRQFRA